MKTFFLRSFGHVALASVLAASGLVAACSTDGGIDLKPRAGGPRGTGGPGETPDPGAPNTKANDPLPQGVSVATPMLRRLSGREYTNSIRDVFSLSSADWVGPELTPDPPSGLWFNNDEANLEVTEIRNDEFLASAESVADLLLAKGKLSPSSCRNVDTDGRPCVDAVLTSYGTRLFRRALMQTEKDRFLGVYDDVAAGADPKVATKWALVAFLQSPNFLYRSELGVEASATRTALTGEEVATALSYAYAGTAPDEALLARGRNGELFEGPARVAVARQLLESARGRELIQDFGKQWLRYEQVVAIQKDESMLPGFTGAREELAAETRAYVDDAFFGGGTLRDFFTSRKSKLTPALVSYYGYAAGTTERPAEQAIGILAHGSLLSRFATAQSSSPSQRGAFVRHQFLCNAPPPPPPNVGQPPDPVKTKDATTRQRYEEQHAVEPSCKGCHQLIDQVGFGLEHFDLGGRYRATENDKPIDPSGTVAGLDGTSTKDFADQNALAQLLSTSTQVADCVGGMMAAYATGSASGKAYSPAETRAGFRDGSVKMLDYYAALAAAPTFSVREGKP